MAMKDLKTILDGKKVLLCEDHPLNTLVATRLLEKVGMVVETAENGLIGVNKFSESEENEFNVVIEFNDFRSEEFNIVKTKITEKNKTLGYILVDKLPTAQEVYEAGTNKEFKIQLYQYLIHL